MRTDPEKARQGSRVSCAHSGCPVYVFAPASIWIHIEFILVKKFLFTSWGFLFCMTFVAVPMTQEKAVAVGHTLRRQLVELSQLPLSVALWPWARYSAFPVLITPILILLGENCLDHVKVL